jgi:hypothetical protein
LSAHAVAEMTKDGLNLADILAVLGGGRIVEEQPDGKYRVEGRTAEGALVAVICRLQERSGGDQQVFVITVWKVIK